MADYQIMQGDCLDVMRGMADNSVDCVITDPPYGKNASKGTNGFGESKNRRYADEWDSFTPSEEYFQEMLRVSKNQIIFGANYFTDKLKPSNCWIVWDKKGDTEFNNPFADCELVWTSFNRVVKKYTLIQQGFINQTNDIRYHPTQKPTELFRAIIQDFTQQGDLILDPFSGSFTTGIACMLESRRFIGIDVNADYCEIGKARIKRANLEPCDIPRRVNLEKDLPLFATV